MSQIPSPAGRRREPAKPSTNGPAPPPWESALYDVVRRLEARVVAAERERDEAVLEAHQLRTQLGGCRERLANWELRRQAWTRERNGLLAQIDQAEAAKPGR